MTAEALAPRASVDGADHVPGFNGDAFLFALVYANARKWERASLTLNVALDALPQASESRELGS